LTWINEPINLSREEMRLDGGLWKGKNLISDHKKKKNEEKKEKRGNTQSPQGGFDTQEKKKPQN